MVKDKKIDPVCGMEGHIKTYGHYFCSENCIKKYEKQHHIQAEDKYCPTCDIGKGKSWYKQPFYLLIIGSILLFIVSYYVKFLNPVFDALLDYLKLIWWAILLGFLLGGIIDRFVPREYIEKYLSRHKKRTIAYAVIFGFLMSACSHGILAIAIELYKKGANTSSVVAFLLASPWANLPITVLLFSFFGINALFIVFGAIFIAITTGLIYQVLERKGMVECDKCKVGEDRQVHNNLDIWADVSKRWKKYKFTAKNIKEDVKGVANGSWALTKMVLWWILIGMILASFARAFVPQDFFMKYMGASMLGLLVTLGIATIIEVCSEGSSPMAFEIFKQTGAFGNSFVFLMAGVVTDYTEIGLIWTNIGKKAAIWLPIITVPQVILLGILFNILL
ncbi:MAG: permease [Nanoarchaeota archaeon]|nr:permease [Nanoarchaeota archaeon]